ncbi:MAG: hypothetical protein R2799_01670 [Crocinitomicaceae bacterium]
MEKRVVVMIAAFLTVALVFGQEVKNEKCYKTERQHPRHFELNQNRNALHTKHTFREKIRFQGEIKSGNRELPLERPRQRKCHRWDKAIR